MDKAIEELIEGAERYMADVGYSEVQLNAFRSEWRAASKLCEQWGLTGYDHSVEEHILAAQGFEDYWNLPALLKRKVRALKCLLTIEEDGGMPPVPHKCRFIVPDSLSEVAESYRAHLETRGVKSATVASNMGHVRAFLSSLGERDVELIGCDDVLSFLDAYRMASPQSTASRLYCLRAFLRFLVDEFGCDEALASSLPIIPGHKNHTVVSSFTADEVRRALDSSPVSKNPRRDRAVLLLAALTGMRASDIKALRFENVDWRKNLICFAQRKTGASCTVHMPEELRLSIIDYLKNERPETEGPLFISSSAPIRGFEESSYTFHRVATAAYSAGEVEIRGRHHGMHSLRHSVATRMLAGDTRLPVISGVLGHSNANTTRRYLEVDVERLRMFALEVPHG